MSEANRLDSLVGLSGFRCIVADPPWAYRHTSLGPKGRSSAVRNYPTMTIDEIKGLPVRQYAAEDSFLWLWITNPVLLEGVHIPVLNAWGFRPQGLLTWVKPRFGMGYTLRSATEHCIVARRGKAKVMNHGTKTWFAAPLGRHSEKPHEAYDIIERLCDGPYLELFARRARPGWTVWGNEVEANGGLDRHPGGGG